MSEPMNAAIYAWEVAIGKDHVLADQGSTHRASTTTFPTNTRIACILRPGSTKEVQTIARIASQHAVPLHPVSGGKHWGYGGRATSADGAALVDLSRMNAIVAHDEDLGLVTVEPGVTHAQLARFLVERRSRLAPGIVGGSPDGTLVGNLFDNGFSSTVDERRGAVSALEVVLSTGERIETGGARFGGPAAHADPWGVGPSFDGLFLQSNLGIITRATFQLPRAAGAVMLVLLGCGRRRPMRETMDALRELTADGVINKCHLRNDYKMLVGGGSYPWERAGGQVPLPEHIVVAARSRWGGGGFAGFAVALASTESELSARRPLIQKCLRPTTDMLWTLKASHIERLRALAPLLRRVASIDIDTFRMIYGDFLGPVVPGEDQSKSLYWRKSRAPGSNLDPERDRCGAAWLTATAPWRGEDVERLCDIITTNGRAHQLEPAIAMMPRQRMHVKLSVLLTWDRDRPGDDERGMAGRAAIEAAARAAGYHPWRVGLPGMVTLPPCRDDTTTVLRRLKDTLDPAGVLSPGRYDWSLQ
jgi:4-cresol dehydrogenase (hydroxylating)